MTHMADLSYTERLQVEQLAREIEQMGVGTVDIGRKSPVKGERSRLREPLARLLGSPVEMGRGTDPQDGSPFLWFSRKEQPVDPVSPEDQAARERLGFSR